MGKGGKVEDADESTAEGPSYEDKLKFVSVIAKPMASKKLTKKLHKLIKKGSLRNVNCTWKIYQQTFKSN